MLIFLVFALAMITAIIVTPGVVRALTSRGVYGLPGPGGDPGRPPIIRMGGVPVCLAASLAVTVVVLLPAGEEDASLSGRDPARRPVPV